MGGVPKASTVHYFCYHTVRDHWRFMERTIRQAEVDTDWWMERARVAAERKGERVKTVSRPFRKTWWQLWEEARQRGENFVDNGPQ